MLPKGIIPSWLSKSLLTSYHAQTVAIVVGIIAVGGGLALFGGHPKPMTINHVLSSDSSSPTPTARKSPTPSPTASPSPSPTAAAAPAVPKAPVIPKVPLNAILPSPVIASLLGLPLYVEPDISAAEQVVTWKASGRPAADVAAMSKLAAQPQSKWLGDWNPDPYEEAKTYIDGAAAAHALPVLTLYDLPGRDCGSFSAGGANDEAAYLAWVNRVSAAAGQQPMMVILEPDALPELECFNATQQAAVYDMLRQAVTILKRDGRAAVYLDAGNTTWQTPATMVSRLNQAGIAMADGFALNVSNFMPTSDNVVYGLQISAPLNGKHFVIDTSRNGLGSNGEWCNPTGRALGAAPTLHTGIPLVDAYLWIKSPGESDGECGRGEPKAGDWWADYALGLAQRAGY